MPLESGNSDAVISRNIKELMETGKYTHDQCIAIAYKKAGRSQTLAKALIEEPGVAVSQARAQLELDTQASNNAILFVVTKRGNVAGNGGNSQGQTDPNPTVDEKVSGEYSKRVVGWQGLNISIENEVGSYREGVNRDGQKWRQRMPYAYGYINQTTGIDDDCVDVFLGPEMDSADYVYIVDARKVNRWDEFDEQKVMLGFKTEQDAKQAFLDSYTDPRFLGPVTEMLVGEFVDKVRNTKDRPTMIKALFSRVGAISDGFFLKSEFKESEHPRAENGEFASASGNKENKKLKNEKITYTLPANFSVKQLAGKTLTGGVPSQTLINGRMQDVVAFDTKVGGKSVMLRIADKPDLAKLAADYTKAEAAEREQEAADKAAKLESAIPGITALMALATRVENDAERHRRQFERMMEDEDNDGARPPKSLDQKEAAKLQETLADNPRAALYLRAKRQNEGAHWADNSGSGAAGAKAMRILESGGSIEDATAALAGRRNFVD